MNNVEELYQQGVELYRQQKFIEAKDIFLKASKLVPNDPQIARMLAVLLAQLGNFKEARIYFEISLKYSIEKPSLQFLNNYGLILRKTGDSKEAIKIFRQIIYRDKNSAEAWTNLGGCYNAFFQLNEAVKCFEKVREIVKDDPNILTRLSFSYHSLCMWDKAKEVDSKLVEISKSKMAIGEPSPLNVHSAFFLDIDGFLFKELAENRCFHMKKKQQASGIFLQQRPSRDNHGRIKVGYVSSALKRHATAFLVQDLFRHHDYDKFEVFIYALNVKGECPYYDKISSSGAHIYELSSKSELEVAEFIQSHEIDVLIDLDGEISRSQPGVFLLKPAPVQVTWLGTPVTSGAPWMDYILVDDVIVPIELENHYTEEILRMPNSFFFNSCTSLPLIESKKEDWNLPTDKFIFASFNISRKIDQTSFQAWCSILKGVENSVLWILVDDEMTLKNLRKEMKQQGVDADRLIIADRLSNEDHLSRLQHADLMLDCFVCNAHTTCVEALYAHLPVLTKIGETFISRVAASILSAGKLDSLITHTIDEFVERGIEIGNSAEELARLKNHLSENKNDLPVFDQRQWVKDWEQILQEITQNKGLC
ncbi:tetratricopeptide repeat protein [Pseudemcibacter aquimaris]|uniref:O-linked N-acetylglucosamine transferase, SPINDLY family protein n=1 Tax=Pseudemcibacter aquimaris TaxID=2857064 RepID=UPI002012B043|nr:tetratricopeptide repeat protein [Pseudemcibacter aquimaris]MCC3860140.1 hypothetical protein [Pseudemcibacter aquimaris]WDU57467.1 hypothetical protein KW060_09685 [Pseudemcibacter aquimaris]